MAKRSSTIRSNSSMRNLRSAGTSMTKLTGQASDKAAVSLSSWATTDHSGMGRALQNMPSMGLLDTLGYILMQFLIAAAGAVLSGALVFLLIAFGIPLLIAIFFIADYNSLPRAVSAFSPERIEIGL